MAAVLREGRIDDTVWRSQRTHTSSEQVYRRRYIKLSGAVEVIAARLPTDSNGLQRIEIARAQLLQALCDGAVRAEGIFREPPTEPDPYEPQSPISLERTAIARPYWKNEKNKDDTPLFSEAGQSVLMTQTDRHGRITSTLDSVAVHWDVNCIIWGNEAGDEYGYEDVHVVASDLDAAFPIASDVLPDTSDAQGATSDNAAMGPDGVTHSTGAPGRPSSYHLVAAEMRRRFAAGDQAPSMLKEAAVLFEWLRNNHPGAARMTEKTIYNRLLDLYRELNVPK